MSLPRSLSILDHRYHRISSRLAGVVGLRWAGMAHALYELLTAAPPPGDASLILAPHLHDGQGSVAIPRGCLYSWDGGDNTTWQWSTGLAGGTWWTTDWDGGNYESASGAGNPHPANLYIWPSPGIGEISAERHGGNTTAEVRLYLGSTGDGNVRLRNRTIGATTSTSAVAVGAFWYNFTDLPLRGGQWNDIVVEVEPGSLPPDTLTVYSLVIAETHAYSLPAMSGSAIQSVTRP